MMPVISTLLTSCRYLLRTWLMFEFKSVACFWFGVALVGFFLAVGGLSALQDATDDHEVLWWQLAGRIWLILPKAVL